MIDFRDKVKDYTNSVVSKARKKLNISELKFDHICYQTNSSKSYEKTVVTEGRKKEAITPASGEIHLFGAVLALIYLIILNKDVFNIFRSDIDGLFKPRRKRRGKRT